MEKVERALEHYNLELVDCSLEPGQLRVDCNLILVGCNLEQVDCSLEKVSDLLEHCMRWMGLQVVSSSGR